MEILQGRVFKLYIRTLQKYCYNLAYI